MSIKVMTWVFGLTVEPRAKIALLAIADHADDDGIAWPSRDLIADKSSQSRTTVNRRMAYLVDLGVISVHERFRDDGSQTTDEIRINLALTPEEVMRRAQGLKAACKALVEWGGCQILTPRRHRFRRPLRSGFWPCMPPSSHALGA